jgi:hypothetical protein
MGWKTEKRSHPVRANTRWFKIEYFSSDCALSNSEMRVTMYR